MNFELLSPNSSVAGFDFNSTKIINFWNTQMKFPFIQYWNAKGDQSIPFTDEDIEKLLPGYTNHTYAISALSMFDGYLVVSLTPNYGPGFLIKKVASKIQ